MTNNDSKTVYVVTCGVAYEGSSLVDVFADEDAANAFAETENEKLGYRYANGTESYDVTEKTLR